MTYVFDLDGTLCETDGTDYANARPLTDRIAMLERLHAEGHVIVIQTARGRVGGRVRRQRIAALTARQLAEWGVPYDDLCVGRKPAGDVYVDDKAVNDRAFFEGGCSCGSS